MMSNIWYIGSTLLAHISGYIHKGYLILTFTSQTILTFISIHFCGKPTIFTSKTMARLVAFFAICVLFASISSATSIGNPLLIKGKAYCDTCRCGFETPATKYLAGNCTPSYVLTVSLLKICIRFSLFWVIFLEWVLQFRFVDLLVP